MGENSEDASFFVEIIAGIGSRTGLQPMSPGLCTLSLVSYATQQDTVGMMHYSFTMPIYLKEMKDL